MIKDDINMTDEELRLIKGIHDLVRNNLTFGESWEVLDEIVESAELIAYWEVEQMLMELYRQGKTSL